MIKKKLKFYFVFSISLITLFIISYKLIFYIPPLLDDGKRNLAEKTMDFFSFGWHFTKASIYKDYLKKNDEANKEFGKAGWYRKKYLSRKFGVNAEDLISVLELYKKLNINSILEKLYIYLQEKEKKLGESENLF